MNALRRKYQIGEGLFEQRFGLRDSPVVSRLRGRSENGWIDGSVHEVMFNASPSDVNSSTRPWVTMAADRPNGQSPTEGQATYSSKMPANIAAPTY